LNLEGTNTAKISREVKERVAQMERDKWITGRGWIEHSGSRPISNPR